MSGSPDLPVPAASPALACFGRPPLIPGEETAAYEALQAGIADNVRPRGVLEEAWVREVGDLTWERLRLRRLKASLMTACANQGLQRLLESLNVPGNASLDLSRRWAARELAAVGQVDAILDAAGLHMDHVMARTLHKNIGEIVCIERMIASVETRRAALLREIEHYRAHLGAGLRRAADTADAIDDAEYRVVVPAPSVAHGAAAAEAVA
jgi:hypothetical protein